MIKKHTWTTCSRYRFFLLIALIPGCCPTTTIHIVNELKKQNSPGKIPEGPELKAQLREILITILSGPQPSYEQRVLVLVGMSGTGKTTNAGKLANYFSSLGKKILLVAADIFKPPTTEQVQAWKQIPNVDVVRAIPGQDTASVVLVGCQKFSTGTYDILIIDTAGRLQTKIQLINDLAHIKRIITDTLPTKKIATLLTVDSMPEHSSFEKTKTFRESTDISGIILTKMDNPDKNGIAISMALILAAPITFITFGEKIDQIKPFDKETYVGNVLTMNR